MELTEHLILQHNFKYVLPGKFVSGPLEARFGWYRQANGRNYFISLKQLLQTEKKFDACHYFNSELCKVLAGCF